MHSYDFERITDMKSMVEYLKRTLSRLEDELKNIHQTIDTETHLIDSLNDIFATSNAARNLTNRQSAIFKTIESSRKDVNIGKNNQEKSDSSSLTPNNTSDNQSLKQSKMAAQNNNDETPKKSVTFINISNTQKTNSENEEENKKKKELYERPNTYDIIGALKESNNYRDFFFEFPLALIAFFDHSKVMFSINQIMIEVEKWQAERRSQFFSDFFQHINNTAFFFSLLIAILENGNIQTLDRLIENVISSKLNFTKIVFFLYDAKTKQLIMKKKKLSMARFLKSGMIYESIINNQQALISHESKLFSQDDAVFLKNNTMMLSTPVYVNNEPVGVLLFYDKFGGFKQFDFIVSQALSNFVSQSMQIIKLKQIKRKSVDVYQTITNSYIEMINTPDSSTFYDVFSNIMTEYFRCDHSRIFKVSDDLSNYYQIPEDSKDTEKYSTISGIVGLAILQKETLNFSNPELSSSFLYSVDRPDEDTTSKSLLVCPVLDENDVPRYAVALYNKNNLENFTKQDEQNIKIFCSELFNIFKASFRRKSYNVSYENCKDEITICYSILDMLEELTLVYGDYSNFESSMLCDSNSDLFKQAFTVMNNGVKSSFFEVNSELFYIDTFKNSILSINKNYQKSLNNQCDESFDPILQFAKSSDTKEISHPNIPTTVYSGTKDTNGHPNGLIKLTALNPNKKEISLKSMFQPNFSPKIKSKSKDNSLNNSQIQFQEEQFSDIKDEKVKNVIKIWNNVIGILIEEVIKETHLSTLIEISSNIWNLIPSDPKYSARIFKELQLIFNDIDESKNLNDVVDVFLVNENEEYLQNTKNIIDYFRVVIAPYNSDNKKVDNSNSLVKSKNEKNDTINRLMTENSSFNALLLQSDTIREILIPILEEFHVLEFLNINDDFSYSLINFIKQMHYTNSTFETWELCVDHIQFLSYLLNIIFQEKFLSTEKVASLFIYFMVLYSSPYLMDPSYSHEWLVKYYIENGRKSSPITLFITAASSLKCYKDFNPIKIIDKIAPILDELETIETFDFLESEEIHVLVAILCKFSYLTRSQEIAKKWIEKRFNNNCTDINPIMRDEIIKYQLEFELKSIILPACSKLLKKGIKVDNIKKIFNTSIANLIGSSL